MNNTSRASHFTRTQIFTLRLWQEELNGDHWEWRGRIQNAISGEIAYFREWANLVDLLQMMLPDMEQD